jgi:predicted transcriptional regulator
MHLLVAAHDFYPDPGSGGTGRYVHETARRLVDRGHDVSVLTRRRGDVASRETVAGVRVARYDLSIAGESAPRMAAQLPDAVSTLRDHLDALPDPDLVSFQGTVTDSLVDLLVDDSVPRSATFHSPWPTEYRILHEFEERGWTERTDDGYVATAAGEHVVTEFTPFAGAMAAIRRLGDAVAWLPADELTIGLQHFRDATVRRPERYDPMDVVDVFTELLREATEFLALTHLVAPEPKQKAMLEGVTTGRLDTKLVLTDDLVGYLDDVPKRDAWFREFVAAGGRAYRYDDSIPCNLFVIDDVVILGQSHPESGHPYAFIESENETVRRWACDLIDEYRGDADRVVPDPSVEESVAKESSDEPRSRRENRFVE